MSKVQSKGEYRVGTDFNPSASEIVNEIKARAAMLIDLIDLIEPAAGSERLIRTHDAEVGRLKALAQTKIEEAAMWAVKAATKREPVAVEEDGK
ncbi:MAG: hypothetical protein AAFZ11_00965 [Pseudomonadota bacterium]